jgi:hypothetical protein
VAGGENYATLGPGINLINPTWSYLVYATNVQYLPLVSITPTSGQGSKITPAKAQMIQDSIKANEGEECTCKNVGSINYALSNRYCEDWGVICHSTNSIFALVPAES